MSSPSDTTPTPTVAVADGSAPRHTTLDPEGPAPARSSRYYAEIFLISFAALLLEVSYTRVISFKLFYYYTYLVIGLALLGIGCGGVIVALSERLRKAVDRTRS